MVGNAATYNYLCAITELSIDTLASNSKNQFTLQWTQKCKNIAEYSSKPTGAYTTTVKLVLNSDDRTLEGTYTTEGASPTSSSAKFVPVPAEFPVPCAAPVSPAEPVLFAAFCAESDLPAPQSARSTAARNA